METSEISGNTSGVHTDRPHCCVCSHFYKNDARHEPYCLLECRHTFCHECAIRFQGNRCPTCIGDVRSIEMNEEMATKMASRRRVDTVPPPQPSVQDKLTFCCNGNMHRFASWKEGVECSIHMTLAHCEFTSLVEEMWERTAAARGIVLETETPSPAGRMTESEFLAKVSVDPFYCPDAWFLLQLGEKFGGHNNFVAFAKMMNSRYNDEEASRRRHVNVYWDTENIPIPHDVDVATWGKHLVKYFEGRFNVTADKICIKGSFSSNRGTLSEAQQSALRCIVRIVNLSDQEAEVHADRHLEDAARRDIDCDCNEHREKGSAMAVLSSDTSFVGVVKHATERGIMAIVLHQAPIDDHHESTLKSHATDCMHLDNVFPKDFPYRGCVTCNYVGCQCSPCTVCGRREVLAEGRCCTCVNIKCPRCNRVNVNTIGEVCLDCQPKCTKCNVAAVSAPGDHCSACLVPKCSKCKVVAVSTLDTMCPACQPKCNVCHTAPVSTPGTTCRACQPKCAICRIASVSARGSICRACQPKCAKCRAVIVSAIGQLCTRCVDFPKGTTLKISSWNSNRGFGFFRNIRGVPGDLFVHACNFYPGEVGWQDDLKGAIVEVCKDAYVEENDAGFAIRGVEKQFLKVNKKPHYRRNKY